MTQSTILHSFSFPFSLLLYLFLNENDIVVGDATLMNTKLEVSMPGFMRIDYLDQIRKEEKIGGGGCAAIYRGVILDRSLRDVILFFYFFLSFENSHG
mgnify:CR=1 FL=1